ncbi:MAG: hypothetical protein QE277_12800 [Flectobacillus sp.]|nr:hypothetical protein [Flectobacillus sp.]
MLKRATLLLLAMILVIACKEKTVEAVPNDNFDGATDQGLIENTDIDEASGLVASLNNKNMLWTHNDSGDKNRIFSIDTLGKGKREFYLEGAENRDWEDMAISSFEDGAYLYVADFGDNIAQYSDCTIYRFLEPKINSATPQSNTIKNVQKISYRYSDGARDAECLLIDHKTKDIYILTKREFKQRLYRLPYPQSYTQMMTAEFVEDVSFSTAINTLFYITAGDVSQDNQELLVRNYGTIYHWRRAANETIPMMLARPASLLPYNYNSTKEPQGEGICFAKNGLGYYTIGETSDALVPVHLYWYARQK